MMLIFGHGYVSRFLMEQMHPLNYKVYCTSRQVKQPIRKGNIEILNFFDPILPSIIDSSHLILTTIPPDDAGVDPVLERYSQYLSKTTCKWIGYLSSTSVYGNHHGAWVDEKTQCTPSHRESKWRLFAEKAWLNLYVKYKLPVHIFRLSGIYGPNRNCLEEIKKGKKSTIVKSGQYFSRIHMVDICQAILASIDSPIGGEIFNISDDEPAPLHLVHQFGADILNEPPLKEISFEKAELSKRAQSFFYDNKKVSNQKLKNCLGFECKYPNYRTGLLEGCLPFLKR
ncbi:MAG: SDR family oxidoreductase [Chlamydiales bacterium]